MDEATQVNLSRIDKNVLVKSNQSTDRDPRVQSFTKSMLKCYELMWNNWCQFLPRRVGIKKLGGTYLQIQTLMNRLVLELSHEINTKEDKNLIRKIDFGSPTKPLGLESFWKKIERPINWFRNRSKENVSQTADVNLWLGNNACAACSDEVTLLPPLPCLSFFLNRSDSPIKTPPLGANK
jgi:hypothetical protein